MKKVMLIAALFALSVPLSACNTVQGVGQDLERVGETLQGQ